MIERDESSLTLEEIKELIKETGWSLERAESLNLVSNYMTVAKAQLAKVKQHYEQAEKDSEVLIRKLLKEIERLFEQNVISSVDIIVKARAELADLEARRIK